LVDKRRIERVVANLVANAEQYAGGVTRIGVEPSAGGVRLVVADRGPGVAPAERERVFERFYRGQVAGQRGATEGTGLGLSLVAEHVRLHGGSVWVEGGDDDGENRFVVELPVSTSGEDTSDGRGQPGTSRSDEPEVSDRDQPSGARRGRHTTEHDREPAGERSAPGAPAR
jgi:signal transduction histidine kinase